MSLAELFRRMALPGTLLFLTAPSCTYDSTGAGGPGVIEGRFRLVYDVELGPGECGSGASEPATISNSFTVRIVE